MNHLSKHIILIGFKHVGKSAIGKKLSQKLHRTFIDLDKEIESRYESEYGKKLSCRQIMLNHGQSYFRDLENLALQNIISSKPAIISLGGGTPLHGDNQKLIKDHIVIHILAPRGVVFERIMVSGRPAFFNPDENPYETFNRLWEERTKTYNELTQFSIDNSSSIENTVERILKLLNSLNG